MSYCEVVIAADGICLQLLRTEFPELNFLLTPAYDIEYSDKSSLLKWKLLGQMPSLIITMQHEHKWLKKVIKEYSIDAVISDNRFGMYSKKIPCFYITHQLQIKTGDKLTEKMLKKMHYSVIDKYSQCWVMDNESNGIAGELSHPKKLPENVKYLGPISRFEERKESIAYDLLVILSGPEPQRTKLEKKIINELESFKGRCVLVRGKDDDQLKDINNNSIEVINIASAGQLNELVLKSEMIVSRSGYTTVMDLIKLQKKAILIPTPGQTEQEYLAKHLMEQNIFYCVPQKELVLLKSLDDAKGFNYSFPRYDWEYYKEVIADAFSVMKLKNSLSLES
jgi:uncharacterized protein (TIGR00661 family)